MRIEAMLVGVVLLTPVKAVAATIVLVHGAFIGSWYWDPVAEGLRGMGHTVVAVDLNAGIRDTSRAPGDVTLDDHVAIVVDAIEEQGEPVVLVSHSYGGRPATGAWDFARDRIAAVIFLEAVAPYGTGGLALPDEVGERIALANANPQALADGFLTPPGYLVARYPDRPLFPLSLTAAHASVPLTHGALPDTPGAYVLGSQSNAAIFRQYARKVSEERGWTIWEIESGHDMVHDAAEVLTRLIDKLSTELVAVGPE